MAAFYRAALDHFVSDDSSRVVGILSSSSQHSELRKRQIRAWEREIEVLKAACTEVLHFAPVAPQWSLLLEYPIPRRRKRLDAVLLAQDVIFCIEFKSEDKAHSLQAKRQVEDYALDLRDFHELSRERTIVPIVVVPKAAGIEQVRNAGANDAVREVRLANAQDLASILLTDFNVEHSAPSQPIDPIAWDNSPYRPVPSIIEAAEALYAGHNVREITDSHAGTTNLTVTSARILEIIRQSQLRSEKTICFVTGIPGAGKTLVGLDVVHNPELRSEERPAGVFLSGNGPLVQVVSAAIARERKQRDRDLTAVRTVGTFIQNVHAFIREGLEKSDRPPVERVVVFDEAQRAWNAEQNSRKNGVDASEPEVMLSIMDRYKDWAVLIALVGGGQEIHNGEAGLSEWGETLRRKFPNWRVVVSPKALDHDTSNAGQRLFVDGRSGSLTIDIEPSLHLDVNARSFRGPRVPEWVDAMLEGDASTAATIARDLREFPFVLTRSIAAARQWLRKQARGKQRAGLVASSGSIRLRAEGLELSTAFRKGNRDMFVHWFLDHLPDIRSSSQLEIAASEFECQGLELDWVGVCWGGDFCRSTTAARWEFRNFAGSRWGALSSETDRQYLVNTYRVLLTRARRGLVVWVPTGDENDITRPPLPFDATYDYLQRCGLTLI